MNIGLTELEETLYWLELLEGGRIVPGAKLAALKAEVSELTAILVTPIKQARKAGGKSGPKMATAVASIQSDVSACAGRCSGDL